MTGKKLKTKNRTVTVRVSEELKEVIDETAEEEFTSVSSLVMRAVVQYLHTKGKWKLHSRPIKKD